MGLWTDIVGSVRGYIRLGLTGVRLKNSSGALAVRNAGDSADAALTCAGLTLTGLQTFAAGADIASASTLDLTAATGNIVRITGTTATSSVTLNAGQMVVCVAVGAWPLTHHSTNFPLPGSADYTCAAGDLVICWQDGDGVKHVQIRKIDGTAVVASSGIPAGVCKNLKVTGSNIATVPLTADSVVMRDAAGNSKLFDTLSVVLNMATSGAGGLDTGSEASSTWYYVWAIGKADGTKSAVFSTSTSAPTLPSGYTYYALVSAVYNDASSNFLLYEQRGNHVWKRDPVSVLSGGTATTETSISFAAGSLPPIATTFDLYAQAHQADVTASAYVSIRWVTGLEMFRLTVGINSVGNINYNTSVVEMPYTGNLYYIWSAATSGRGLTTNITGFKLPIGE